MPLPVFTTGPDSASTTVTDSVWDNTSGDGDWSTAGNWEDNAVPTNGNRVYLGNFTSTIDQGLGQSAINLDELNIGRDFRGELDGLTIDAGIVRINKPHGTLSLDGNYRNIYVEDTPAGATGCTLDGTIGNLHVSRTGGTVIVAAGATVETIRAVAKRGSFVDMVIRPTVTTEAGGDLDIVFSNGRLVTSSSVTNLELHGSCEVQFKGSASVTNMRIAAGSTVRWDSSGNVGDTSAIMHGGVLTFTNNTNSSVSVENIVQWGGVVDMRTGLDSISVPDYTYNGGTVLFDSGRTVTY
jgi:hypothetical protein